MKAGDVRAWSTGVLESMFYPSFVCKFSYFSMRKNTPENGEIFVKLLMVKKESRKFLTFVVENDLLKSNVFWREGGDYAFFCF